MARIPLLPTASLAAMLLLAAAAPSQARPPEIRNVDIRGLQIGGVTPLTIDGIELLPAPRVFLDDQPIDAVVDPKSASNRLLMTLNLPDKVRAGFATLRLATAEGFSNGVVVGVDHLPERLIAAETETLPAALNGSVPAGTVSRTAFTGKAGDEWIIEVEAKRLSSKLRPVLHLYDAKRRQIGWAMPSGMIGGDCRLVARLPADGRYIVELHDTQYAPPGPSHFRLKIGRWEYADLTFPVAATRGAEIPLQFIGRVATPSAVFRAAGEESLALIPFAPQSSGTPPTVQISDLPEILATPQPENAPQALPAAPVAVNGRLQAVGQRARFLLPAAPGAKLLVEAFAERLGSPVDTLIELKNRQGSVLASNDDAPVLPGIPGTTDSKLEFTVPEGVDALEISLRDTLDTANDASVYRLAITPADPPPSSFTLIARTDVVNVAEGEFQTIEILARRQNYEGPIQLQIPDLPAGVALQGGDIPAGSSGTLLTVTHSGSGSFQGIRKIRGASPDGKIVRTVRWETTADDRTPIWLREKMALATAPKPESSFTVAWTDTPPTNWVPTTKVTSQLKVVRPPSLYGPVRLTLITSQDPPRVNGQINPAFNVRQERPIELPVDPQVKAAGDALAAIEKPLAETMAKLATAQGDAKTAAETTVKDLIAKKDAAVASLKAAEAKAAYSTDFPILLPATLTDSTCDLAIRAELLTPDRSTVVRTTFTPTRRLPVLNPLELKLASAGPVEAKLDPKSGAALKIDARIDRKADYKGAVTVLVTNLPPGVALPAVSVPAEKSEFQLDLRIPPNFAATAIKGIKLVAQGPGDPLAGGQPLKSAEVELAVTVTEPVESK